MDSGVVFVGVVLIAYMIVSTWWMSGLSNRIEDMELRSNFINSVGFGNIGKFFAFFQFCQCFLCICFATSYNFSNLYFFRTFVEVVDLIIFFTNFLFGYWVFLQNINRKRLF